MPQSSPILFVLYWVAVSRKVFLMIYQRCIVLFLCILLAAGPLAAQSTTTEKTAEAPTKEQQEAVKQQALVLLREVADEGGRMRLVQNRIFFQTTAANLLWESD